MKSINKILAMVIISAIFGFIALPETFSFSSGQHQFQQIDPNNPDQFCAKCHGNMDTVRMELASSGVGLYNGGQTIHNNLRCVECHQITNGYGVSNGDKSQHASIIPNCIECHNPAYLGNQIGNVTNELESSSEAHNQFNDESDSVACIGCHTGVSVSGSISYTYDAGIQRMGLTIG